MSMNELLFAHIENDTMTYMLEDLVKIRSQGGELRLLHLVLSNHGEELCEVLFHRGRIYKGTQRETFASGGFLHSIIDGADRLEEGL